MKIGLAVSTSDAPPDAFVALRGDLEDCIDRCAEMSYDGVELALRHVSQVRLPQVRQRLAATGLQVPCISTGQVFAVDGLCFTHPDSHVRQHAVERIVGFIHLAAEFGAMVNMGRVRGMLTEGKEHIGRQHFLDCLTECADVAEALGVSLIIEPVNRYELNFINSCAQGADLIRETARRCLRLMPDTFHMNIEDASFHHALTTTADLIGYVHVADSNRLAPGWGHLPFPAIFATLQRIGYHDWITAEILPLPDPHQAASQAIRFLRSSFGADAPSPSPGSPALAPEQTGP